MIKFSKRNLDKRYMTIAIIMITVGTLILGFGIYKAHSSQADVASSNPNFHALIPNGKTIAQLGGWNKLSSPTGDAFYVYVDNVSGVDVNVSQQTLPGKFKENLNNELTDLARAYNANVKLDANGTKVYVGTSAKGPQSVIFVKNDILVLMKSWATISDANWVTYINALK